MTVYIVRHMDANTLGYLQDVVEAAGFQTATVDVSPNTPEDRDKLRLEAMPDLEVLILLGGSMNADQQEQFSFLSPEKALIQAVMTKGIPIFGICLGSQLIARSLGAAVTQNPVKEVGWTPIHLTQAGLQDPLFSVLGDGNPQFQWHEDRWELPPGATLLAGSADCAHQAYRIGASHYAVQFHPEMTLETIQQWLDESHSLSSEAKATILADSHRYLSQYQARNTALLSHFLKSVCPVSR